jgi:cytochrome c5
MRQALVGTLMLAILGGVAWAADGAAVYDKKCKACHSIAGVGGPMAKMGGTLDVQDA